MVTNRTALACTTLASLALLGSAYLTAGPLNPPAGPVASTHKTLTEIEPRIAINAANTPGDADSLFKIEKQGSYYLTGNVTAVVGKHGIEIAASGVTVDLNGFDLVGVPGMGAFDGVTTTVSNLTNIEIRNGSVRNWGGDGVNIGTIAASNSMIRDMRANGNLGVGIVCGPSNTISGCVASNNGTTGIATDLDCTMNGCTASNNGSIGINASTGSTISGCTASSNGTTGVTIGSGCTISGCTAFSNGTTGIVANSGSTITGCMTFGNGTEGISATFGCTISECTVRANATDGIRVSGQCFVIGNMCSTNGNGGDGAGIRVINADNRIEGNNCSGADRGIDIDSVGNIIIKNSCTANTVNWVIIAGNAYGPIVATPAGAAVNGNTAAAALGSTDPNANFTY